MAGITQEAFDDRGNPTRPIARAPVVEFTTTSGQNTKTTVFWANGELVGFIYQIPNLTTDTTFDLSILDQDDTILYTETGIADDAATIPKAVFIDPTSPIFLFGSLKMKIDFTTAQVATIKVVPIIK